jgi:3-hydroxyisobutyrate dehydrogenase
MRVGLLGVGLMGSAMAHRLLEQGFAVSAWDRTPRHAEALAEKGARPVSRPEEVVGEAGVVITMLRDVDAVLEVVEPLLPGWPRGAIWLQMSSVGVAEADRLVALARASGVLMVDAPVSGSTGPAEHGELTILASGPEETRTRVEGVLGALGSRTLWVGEAGAGSRVKVVVNHWMIAATAVLAESVRLSEATGIDAGQLARVLEGGPLGMPYALAKLAEMREHRYPAGFPIRLALKDLRLAREAAQAAGLEAPMLDAALARYSRVAETRADDDLGAVYEA